MHCIFKDCIHIHVCGAYCHTSCELSHSKTLCTCMCCSLLEYVWDITKIYYPKHCVHVCGLATHISLHDMTGTSTHSLRMDGTMRANAHPVLQTTRIHLFLYNWTYPCPLYWQSMGFPLICTGRQSTMAIHGLNAPQRKCLQLSVLLTFTRSWLVTAAHWNVYPSLTCSSLEHVTYITWACLRQHLTNGCTWWWRINHFISNSIIFNTRYLSFYASAFMPHDIFAVCVQTCLYDCLWNIRE